MLNYILQARERRSFLRKSFAKNTLSLSLNIPGFPKFNFLISKFFDEVLSELIYFLQSHNILLDFNNSQKFNDPAGIFYIIAFKNQSISVFEIKNLCETFENNHKVGRVIDIDIFDAKGYPVSSDKQKQCFVCKDKPAVVCMREQKHSFIELRKNIFQKMKEYTNEKEERITITEISITATKSLLYELSITPKPGLVDFNNSGSHTDMNYITFLNSISSLSVFWEQFAKLGYNYKGDLKNALPLIRNIGLVAESQMFALTIKVNTHKGLIFIMGLSCFAAAYSFKIKKIADYTFISHTIKQICSDIVKNELENTKNVSLTHGETVFKKYGEIASGARGFAESGFKIVFEKIVPFLEDNFTENQDKVKEFQNILKTTLCLIMSDNNDTNVLYRSDLQTLEMLKKLSEKSFENMDNYVALCNFCKTKNISPGGSADILAVSLFFFYLK